MADLTTAAYVQSYLPDLSAAELLALPATITGVSRLIQNFTGRQLAARPTSDGTVGPYEEIITPNQRGPVLLREYPVTDICRVSVNPVVALTVQNTDDATNQQARAKITLSAQAVIDGSVVGGGITLQRYASGTLIPNVISFSAITPPTIQALANAVNAVGGGWSAEVTDGFGLWGVSELVAGDGAQGAMGVDAEFLVYSEDADYECDQLAGTITVESGQDDPFTSLRWGPTAGLEFGETSIQGRDRGFRVAYAAGYDPIPDDLQQAVVEAVKAAFERKATSSTLLMEKTDTWSWTVRDMVKALPDSVVQVLAYYRDHAR